jgi:hypothetical protein
MDEVSDFTDVVRNIMKRLGPDAPLSKILWECCREVMADLELKRSPSALTNMIEAEKAEATEINPGRKKTAK